METIDIMRITLFVILLILSYKSGFLRLMSFLIKYILYIFLIALGVFLATKFYSYTEGGAKGVIIAIVDVVFLSSPFTYFMVTERPEKEGILEFIQDTIGLIIYCFLHLIFGMILLLIGSLIFGYDPFSF